MDTRSSLWHSWPEKAEEEESGNGSRHPHQRQRQDVQQDATAAATGSTAVLRGTKHTSLPVALNMHGSGVRFASGSINSISAQECGVASGDKLQQRGGDIDSGRKHQRQHSLPRYVAKAFLVSSAIVVAVMLAIAQQVCMNLLAWMGAVDHTRAISDLTADIVSLRRTCSGANQTVVCIGMGWTM